MKSVPVSFHLTLSCPLLDAHEAHGGTERFLFSSGMTFCNSYGTRESVPHLHDVDLTRSVFPSCFIEETL